MTPETPETPGTPETTAANALTAAWARTVTAGTVLSGAGVHPLLHLLATAASGPARDELLAVAPAPLALPSSAAVRTAIGLWPRADVPLTPSWRSLVAGVLTGDQAPLDAWAASRTGGLIPRLPAPVDDATLLLLGSALAVTTTWDEPFDEGLLWPLEGPWRSRQLVGLTRFHAVPGPLKVVSPAGGRPLTTVTVRGSDDIDVVLLLGEPGVAPGDVLAAGIETPRTGPDRVDGPGVQVGRGWQPPGLYLTVPRFTVSADHDLLAHADLFGLRAATDHTRGHFPGLSPWPLAVSHGTQAATATFTARGFEAAAVSVLELLAGGAPTGDNEQVHVTFDRPFGFLAEHRPTGLVLFAGWVDEPTPWEPEVLVVSY
ncbi:serpin family protein [Dactylosporangium sp. NPDC000521]|uniref:serpin family protein n=1 Tax=Dactylosporangium sp. NPDC000521 TaxID=3363975 RepID=UPI00367C8318